MPDEETVTQEAPATDTDLADGIGSQEDEQAAFDSEEEPSVGAGLVPPDEKPDTKPVKDEKLHENTESEENKPDDKENKPAKSDQQEGEPDNEEDDDDEDLKRGKELLDAIKEKEAAEAAKKEDAPTETTRDDAEKQAKHQRISQVYNQSWDEKSIKDTLLKVIPPNLFPKDPVKLEDGSTLDFGTVMEEVPELPSMIAMMAHNVIEQMVATGYLVGNDRYSKDVEKYMGAVDQRIFTNTIINRIPKAREIVSSTEFQEWAPKQKPELQALWKSNSPLDRVAFINRFLNREVIGKTKVKNKELETKRSSEKKNFDSIHAARKKPSQKTGTPSSAMTPEEQELEGFMGDD